MSSRVNEVSGENLQDPPQSKILATPMIMCKHDVNIERADCSLVGPDHTK